MPYLQGGAEVGVCGVKHIFVYPEIEGTVSDLLDAGPVGHVASAAEECGWDGFAMTEHPAPSLNWLTNGGHQTLDPFVALGHAAAFTSRIRLITYLAVAAYRNPLLLAKAAATLDRLSEGRFVLGLGVGYQKGEFFALGASYEERGALLDEALAVLPLHWSGEPFSFQGRRFNARETIALPRPTQSPIPIWIGGNARASIERAASRAQGWMPLFGGSDLFRTTKSPSIGTIAELASAIIQFRDLAGGRDEPLSVVVAYNAFENVPVDEPGYHADNLQALEEVGVTHVAVTAPLTDFSETREFLESYGSRYIAS